VTPEQVVAVLVASLTSHANQHLPDYVKDQWVIALGDVLGSGVTLAWAEIIKNLTVAELEANTVEIRDERK
tara:strand:- start:546 stop:758 length:213 start_codon:yes stop_codon:yes gene_type:complete